MTPLVWIAAALALGIALFGGQPQVPVAWLALALAALVASCLLLRRNRLWLAWALALAGWCFVGALAASLERAAQQRNRVDLLVDSGRLDLSEPLRWQGRLREDPLGLPWGYRYEISIERVEIGGRLLPVSGGLRLTYYQDPQQPEAPPAVRAGDRVEALAKAVVPRDFLDPGAFDYRGFLARQGVELTASLRSARLLRRVPGAPLGLRDRLARARGRLLRQADLLFGPREAPVVRAMLLGDRSFVDWSLVTAFQKAAAYHVLVIAGLHVAALSLFLFWVCRRLRLPPPATAIVVLAALAGYVAVVQDRPPIERAALMAAMVVLARVIFRRVEVLNSVALAAVILLLARPSDLADPSFRLSFLSAAIIAAVALPWIARTSSPYRLGLEHLADVTRDGGFPPRVIQFRLDLRQLAGWLDWRLPERCARWAGAALVAIVRAGLRLWEIVLLSFAIQIGLLPMLAADFHRVALAGPVANIPAVLLTGLIVPLGFLALSTGMAWERLGMILAKPVNWLVAALVDAVTWFSRLPWLSYRIPGPPEWLILAFLALLALLGVALLRGGTTGQPKPLPRWSKWALGLPLAAAALAVAIDPFPARLHRGELEVTVLDVGQGDSIFVAFPDGRTMLVDGGGLQGSFTAGGYRSGLDIGEEVVSPYLWSRGLKRLDVVELTHAHHDHMGGLPAVLENFHVGQLWVGHDVDDATYRSLLGQARSLRVAVAHRRTGDGFDWGGVDGRFLWPPNDDAVRQAGNNDSLVLLLADGNTRFLLPGDIEKPVEDTLAGSGVDLQADFLKVPHHGSKTSSTAEFLAAVRPKFAVASAGAGNPFGHPNAEVVERYKQDGVALWRTDRNGAVTALTKGRQVTVRPYVRPGS
ncbi:MAG TPA: ComEC/Rec2 family competence protein [Candidatus Acidoferrales bacterium]|nr:ComEC/Rec2 family competence protein [Candidatus Acidoferrales bacterium]